MRKIQIVREVFEEAKLVISGERTPPKTIKRLSSYFILLVNIWKYKNNYENSSKGNYKY